MRFLVVLLALLAACSAARPPCCTCGSQGDDGEDDFGTVDLQDGGEGARGGVGGEGTTEGVEASPRRVRAARAARAACESDETELNLQHMGLQTLPECISPFAVKVNVSGNRLLRLPSSAQLSPLLVDLDASGNGVGAAEGDELRALSALEQLRVGGNPLRALRFLPQPCALRSLHAQRCALTSLQDVLICGLLEHLDASDNLLGALAPGALFPLGRLTTLDLSRNPLGALASRAFAGLQELKSLRLSGSELGGTPLPRNVLDLPKLESLDLSYNEFSSLSTSTEEGSIFGQGSPIFDLNLEGNKFKTIPWENLQSLKNLSNLNLSNNKISRIEGNSLGNHLPSLRKLSLQSNNINAFPDDAFHGLQFLEELDISWNPVSTIPTSAFSGLNSLRALSVSGCPLKALPFSMNAPMPSLSHLDAMGVSLLTLPAGALAGLPKIQCLNLHDNPFKSLSSEAFVGASKLKKLYLGGSKQSTLRKLPEDVFHDLIELETLDFANNKLEGVPNGIFQNNYKLQRINLDNNKLIKVPKGVFRSLGRLREVRVAGNALLDLPDLSACCGDLRRALFANNSIAWPQEDAVRALLRPGGRRVSDMRDNPVRPSALLSLAQMPGVSLEREDNGCGCGRVWRGEAELRLCVDVRCGEGAGAEEGPAARAWQAAVEEAGRRDGGGNLLVADIATGNARY